MCDICLRAPCANGCPNKEYPHNGKRCSYCFDWILVGQEFAYIGGTFYHADCISDDMTKDEILELFDVEIELESEEETA